MRYTLEKMNLPWGLVLVEGVPDELETFTQPDENGIWTDGGTIYVFAFSPTRVPVSISIQNEIGCNPGFVRIFDDEIEVDDEEIEIGDLNDKTFVISCRVPVADARIVIEVDRPNDATRLILSIPDMTRQRVESDEVTGG